jgi:hypothetical protein
VVRGTVEPSAASIFGKWQLDASQINWLHTLPLSLFGPVAVAAITRHL